MVRPTAKPSHMSPSCGGGRIGKAAYSAARSSNCGAGAASTSRTMAAEPGGAESASFCASACGGRSLRSTSESRSLESDRHSPGSDQHDAVARLARRSPAGRHAVRHRVPGRAEGRRRHSPADAHGRLSKFAPARRASDRRGFRRDAGPAAFSRRRRPARTARRPFPASARPCATGRRSSHWRWTRLAPSRAPGRASAGRRNSLRKKDGCRVARPRRERRPFRRRAPAQSRSPRCGAPKSSPWNTAGHSRLSPPSAMADATVKLQPAAVTVGASELIASPARGMSCRSGMLHADQRKATGKPNKSGMKRSSPSSPLASRRLRLRRRLPCPFRCPAGSAARGTSG